jgi:Flp pilus assembly protein TadG
MAARRDVERGSVTAETALALPAVVIVLAAVVGAAAGLAAQVRCIDAARAGARLAARGESDDRVIAAAQRLAPSGSRIDLAPGPGSVTVRVVTGVRIPLPVPPVQVQASAVADRETP